MAKKRLFERGTASGEFVAGIRRGRGVNVPLYEDLQAAEQNAAANAQRAQYESQMDQLKMLKLQQEVAPQGDPNTLPFEMPGMSSDMPTLLPPVDGGLIGDTGAQSDPVTRMAEARDYVGALKKMPLGQEGQKGAIRLRQILDTAMAPDLRPAAREELLQQFEQERERLRVEDDVQEIPTLESESQKRVFTAENGMQQIMQPDGRIDVKDLTSKADLKRMEMESKNQTTMEQAAAGQQEQASERKLQQQEEERAKRMEIQQQRVDRRNKFREAYVAEKPISERKLDVRKELERRFKAMYPKAPMRTFSDFEIEKAVEAEFMRDLRESESLLGESFSEPKTADDRIRLRMQDDPEQFAQDVIAMRDKMIEEDPVTYSTGELPKREAILERMRMETPEAIIGDFQKIMDAEMDATASTTLLDDMQSGGIAENYGNLPQGELPEFVQNMFGQNAAESIMNADRYRPDNVRQQMASELGVDPAEVDDATVMQGIETRQEEDFRRLIVPQVAKARESSDVIKETESMLSERFGSDVDLGSVVDIDTIGHFTTQGSKSPIEDAAKAMKKALASDTLNINLMDSMTRGGAKKEFPLVSDESDAGFALAGVAPGQVYRLGDGTIKEREASKNEPVVPDLGQEILQYGL